MKVALQAVFVMIVGLSCAETVQTLTSNFIYGIHIFLFIDWLKVRHVIKNKLTILKKLGQSRK